MPATQHLGIEGKEDHMFKVTSNCTKSEANLVTRETKIPRECHCVAPAGLELCLRYQPLKQLEL